MLNPYLNIKNIDVKNIPKQPGVYKFLSNANTVLYVGKANNLQNRIKQYLTYDKSKLHGITAYMLEQAHKIEWTIVASEVEAFILEWEWITKYKPKYNILFKDDKSYPYIMTSYKSKLPIRIFISRANKKYKNYNFYGPFPNAKALNTVFNILCNLYPVRTCTDTLFNNAKKQSRPCLKYHINRCSAPCVNPNKIDENNQNIQKIVKFITKQSNELLKKLKIKMQLYAENLEFEKALDVKNVIESFKKTNSYNTVIFKPDVNFDLFSYAEDDMFVIVCIFSIRQGKILFQKTIEVEKKLDFDIKDIIEKVVLEFYRNNLTSKFNVPPEIIVPFELASPINILLSKSKKINIHTAQKGKKSMLYNTAQKNATDKLLLEQKRRTAKLNVRSEVLNNIKEVLQMKMHPLRIECYDISHMGGSSVVASMVVFEDGIKRPDQYRKFELKIQQNNDVASLKEVLIRRFKHSDLPDGPKTDTKNNPKTNTPKTDNKDYLTANNIKQDYPKTNNYIEANKQSINKFAYKPNLIIIDGGLPQVNGVYDVFKELGITDVTLCGLAKRNEEVILPHKNKPVIVSGNTLLMFQRIRDEAHRFAITYSRKKHLKKSLNS
jgi:excinuclease ABC subunit C